MNIFIFVTIVTCLVLQIDSAHRGPLHKNPDNSSTPSGIPLPPRSARNFAINLYKTFVDQSNGTFVMCPLASFMRFFKMYCRSINPTTKKLREAFNFPDNCRSSSQWYHTDSKQPPKEERTKLYFQSYNHHLSNTYFQHHLDTAYPKLVGSFQVDFVESNYYEAISSNTQAGLRHDVSMELAVDTIETWAFFDNCVSKIHWQALANESVDRHPCLRDKNIKALPQQYVHKQVNSRSGNTIVAGQSVRFVAIPLQDNDEPTAEGNYLLIIEPEARNMLPHIEKNINGTVIQTMLRERNVIKHVILPVIKLSPIVDIDDNLKQIFNGKVFENKADVFNMTEDQAIRVDSVTVATTFLLEAQSDMEPSICTEKPSETFITTGPFIFAIVTPEDRIIFMMGRYVGE